MANPELNLHQSTGLDKDLIWSLMLDINEFARTQPRPRKCLRIRISPEGNQIFSDDLSEQSSDAIEWIILMPQARELSFTPPTSTWDGLYLVTHNQAASSLDKEGMISEYLPYALLPWKAESLKRAITVAHFAQSLDGKIATHTGHSRWIGNHENLLHAHRMRALCEGILIGKGTLTSDEPALTVRHVPGQNPQRIILFVQSLQLR